MTNWFELAKEICYGTRFECPSVCDHAWDGEVWKSEDGCIESATCSKCGVRAIDVDLMKLP